MALVLSRAEEEVTGVFVNGVCILKVIPKKIGRVVRLAFIAQPSVQILRGELFTDEQQYSSHLLDEQTRKD